MELQYASRKRKATKQLRGTPQQRLRAALAAVARPPPAAMLNRRGVRNKETGFYDIGSASYALDTTGSVTLLATIANGTNVNTRVGKKIVLKSIQCRASAQANAATTVTSGAILIIYDERPTGTLPTVLDVISTATANCLMNDANSGRFRVLRRFDWVFAGNATAPATGLEVYNCDFYAKIGRPAVFKAAGTGAIGDIEQGALYLVTIGSTAAGTGAASFTGTFRTRFIDN